MTDKIEFRMRRLFLVLSLLLMACVYKTYAETIETIEPKVAKAYKSNAGKIQISNVVVDDNNTIVFFTLVSARSVQGSSVAISEKMTMKVKGSKEKFSIKQWGVVDAWGEMSPLQLNAPYSVRPGYSYTFFMVFDSVPAGCTKIDIDENITNGFYWKGVEINNVKKKASKGSTNKDKKEKNSFKIDPKSLQSI